MAFTEFRRKCILRKLASLIIGLVIQTHFRYTQIHSTTSITVFSDDVFLHVYEDFPATRITEEEKESDKS